MGGTVTGEHGVGVEKLSSMCVQFSPAEREQMDAVKRAFDPAGLLNPGKVMPTLHRCAEYGRMHVRRGLSRFPSCRGSERRPMRPALSRRRRAHARRAAPRAGRCCLRGGGTKDFYGERRTATCSTCAASRHRRLRADRAGRHRARRHAAGRARGGARRAGPVPAVRAAALRPERDRRRHGRGGPRRGRRARRAPARCATTCSA